MLQRALGSGWGLILPGILVAILSLAGLSESTLRAVIVLGLLLTPAMLYQKRLRHFILLPSGVALIGGILLLMFNLKVML